MPCPMGRKQSATGPNRFTHRCHMMETGNDSYRFKASSDATHFPEGVRFTGSCR
ncbi:hypothetical protein GLR48_24935 [Loktanella sp. M215]|nr:hypothetical protein [Loktanella sp. M215]